MGNSYSIYRFRYHDCRDNTDYSLFAKKNIIQHYVEELDLDFMVTCFNQPISIRESRLEKPLSTQYPISCSNYVSNPYLGNLDNSIMDGKQGKTCFYFLDYL